MVDCMRDKCHHRRSAESGSIGPFSSTKEPHLDRVTPPAEVIRVPDAEVGARELVEFTMLRVILALGAAEALSK